MSIVFLTCIIFLGQVFIALKILLILTLLTLRKCIIFYLLVLLYLSNNSLSYSDLFSSILQLFFEFFQLIFIRYFQQLDFCFVVFTLLTFFGEYIWFEVFVDLWRVFWTLSGAFVEIDPFFLSELCFGVKILYLFSVKLVDCIRMIKRFIGRLHSSKYNIYMYLIWKNKEMALLSILLTSPPYQILHFPTNTPNTFSSPPLLIFHNSIIVVLIFYMLFINFPKNQ